MKLLDIKNNLVKVSYNTDELVALGSFLVISDNSTSYVAQVVNLKADPTSNYAIGRLILTFNDKGILDNYNGAIPSLQAKITRLDSNDLLSLLPVEKPVIIGELAQQQITMKLDEAIFEKRLLICAEKFSDIATTIYNAVNQLFKYREKVVVIDTDNTFTEFDASKFKKDFKIPLTAQMIDFIYATELDEIDASTKAVIEDILLDVQEYAKTVDFIPINSFINVVTQQYEETQISELALLRNKLLKYYEEGIFAETKEDSVSLEAIIKSNSISVLNISDVPDELQKELINYIQNTLESCDEYLYSFVKINNKNSDKKTLLNLTNGEKVFTTIICNHSYKYVSELKQLAENIILFAPQTTQHDFAPYNTFLSKLNAGEFIVYGDLTQNIPFIVESARIEDLVQEESTVSDNNYIEEDIQPQPAGNNIDGTDSNIQGLSELSELDELSDLSNSEDILEIAEPEELSNNKSTDIMQPVTVSDEVPADLYTETVTEVVDKNNDDIIEQVAKEVDETFISNKIEEIPPIENLLDDGGETLTEDDLDFLEELPAETVGDEISEDTADIVEEPIQSIEELPADFTDEPIIDENDIEILENNSDTNESSYDVQENSTNDELPVFPSETPTEVNIDIEQGDTVSHPKYGQGVVEKLIKYGNKTLCSISFDNVGRRLLDPTISELQKLS